MNKTIPIILAIAIAGCATKPENIAPAFISEAKYANWTCEAMAKERARYDEALAQASGAQRKARKNDTWGVILIGIPVSSLSGANVAGEVARLKGEVDALARAQGATGC